MPYYPIFVDLKGKRVLVVGGGAVAQRKIESLLEYGAVVHVISRDLTPKLERYIKEGKIRCLGREFREDDLKAAFMVIAATDDPVLNRRVSDGARNKGMLINAVDQPAECNFILPSVLRRGDLLIAVSTSGKSPALAKKVREGLEKRFGREYELFLVLMGYLRKEILSRGLSANENRQMFHEIVNSPVLEAIEDEDWNGVATILNKKAQIQWSSEDVLKMLSKESSPLMGQFGAGEAP